MQELASLDDQLRRPPDGMNYRDYPRLQNEVQSLMRSAMGTQGAPTEGQLEVMAELDADALRLANELERIVGTTISQLNAMLGSLPAIVVPSSDSGPGSESSEQ